MVNFSEKFAAVLEQNIERGRAQGYYREDFNASVYARLFFQLMLSYDSSPYLEEVNIGRQEFQNEVMTFYMNAITTEKGKKILKKINKIQ